MYNHLKLTGILAFFFLIAVATSEDFEEQEYECIVEVTDDSFILTSLTDVDIIHATVDAFVLDEFNNSSQRFRMYDHNQEALTTDSIAFSMLRLQQQGSVGQDTTGISLDTVPTLFSMWFMDQNQNIYYFKDHQI